MQLALYLAKIVFTYVFVTSQTLSFITVNQASFVLTFTSSLRLELKHTYCFEVLHLKACFLGYIHHT